VCILLTFWFYYKKVLHSQKLTSIFVSDGPDSTRQPYSHTDPEACRVHRGRRSPLSRSRLRRGSLHLRQPPEGTTRERTARRNSVELRLMFR
jgi:hypothetical protein